MYDRNVISIDCHRASPKNLSKYFEDRGNQSFLHPLISDGGQAMVEMVIVAITFLFTILGVIQLAMILNAYSLVRYAAYNAARAASVHGADPEKMEEAARLSLLAVFPRHGRADTAPGVVDNYLGAMAADKLPGLTYFDFDEPITSVKIVHPDDLPCGEVVTFDDPLDTADSVITVQVVHHYELVIPLVNRIIFKVRTMFESGTGYHGENLDNLAAGADKERRTGTFKDVEFRYPLVADYTIRMQSDYSTAACATTTTTSSPTTTTTSVASTTTSVSPCGINNNPKSGGLPLDHCFNYGKTCDKAVADLFCQAKGCSGASSFALGPPEWETWIMGDGTSCSSDKVGVNYKFCTPFSLITCAP